MKLTTQTHMRRMLEAYSKSVPDPALCRETSVHEGFTVFDLRPVQEGENADQQTGYPSANHTRLEFRKRTDCWD